MSRIEIRYRGLTARGEEFGDSDFIETDLSLEAVVAAGIANGGFFANQEKPGVWIPLHGVTKVIEWEWVKET